MKIISKIIGGLGNQMFQYANGFACAKRNGWEHYLDILAYNYYFAHQGFELKNVFNCSSAIASPKILWQTVGLKYVFLHTNYKNNQYFSPKCLINEPSPNYWQDIHNIKANSYLSGYWQSLNYFDDIIYDLRQEFSFKQLLIDENLLIKNKINNSESISLHVRRGDYITNKNAFKTHGICSKNYYESAIYYLLERTQNPVFYIFSDDMRWVKNNLDIPAPAIYIDHNKGFNSHYDMQLMSICNNHIIANSSFSWWGAWLGNNPDKIVIAPKKWFADPMLNNNNLIPKTWITL